MPAMPAPTYADRPWLANYPEGVPATLDYPTGSLVDFLQQSAAAHPQRAALVFYGKQTTYAGLLDQVQRAAAGLRRLGVAPGDRVAVMLPNCPQAVVAYYATLWVGGIVVQVNPLYTARELRFQLVDAEAKYLIGLDLLYPRIADARPDTQVEHVIITGIQESLPFPLNLLFPLKARRQGQQTKLPPGAQVRRWQELLAGSPDPKPHPTNPKEDLALLQYTGGTTGTSKGVMLTHFNLVANCEQIATWNAEFAGQHLTIMGALPFFHVYGMTAVMNYGIYAAGTMILVPRFEVETILKLIQKHRPNVFPGAPTMYVALNNHPDVARYDLGSIRACLSGAAPLPQEVQETFERLTGGNLVEGYGLTEASPVTHANPITGRRKLGSIGLPWPDTDCRIVDPDTGQDMPTGEVGELAIKGPQVMQGYWNSPEDTAVALRDGWLFTGDMARMDEDGYFYIVDRKKDLIIAGGFNIYPREVEEVLYEHPAVQEAAVIGVPDAYRGETVKAFIVRKPGTELTAEAVEAYCRERLAAFKVPRQVEFRDELPKSLVGKILRRLLVEEEHTQDKSEGSGG